MAGSRERLNGDDDRFLREISNEIRALARTREQALDEDAEPKYSKTRGSLHVTIETDVDLSKDTITIPNPLPEGWEGAIGEIELRIKKPTEDLSKE